MNNFSIIFDLDGVIVDSNPFHKKSWKMFCEKHNISITDQILEKKVFGRTGSEALSILFNTCLNDELIKSYTEEIDGIFRESFSQYIKPIDGLIEFLTSIQKENIKTAIATSAPPENVDFVMDKTGLSKYFHTIVDNTYISKSKPNPEIYLKTAKLIGEDSEKCIVIEDSLSGIEAAIKAGMKVIGITTTHSAKELLHTDLVINNFNKLNISMLVNIINS
ncbi:MAG: HAD family phosphatase [Ignavibacteria bacterium]|jgi:HAD superfamily hydrolase (TIGR01509 family)